MVVDPCVAGRELEVVDGIFIEVLDGQMRAGLQCNLHTAVPLHSARDVFKCDVVEHDLVTCCRFRDDVIAVAPAEEEAVHAVLAAGEGIIAQAAVEGSRAGTPVDDAVVRRIARKL